VTNIFFEDVVEFEFEHHKCCNKISKIIEVENREEGELSFVFCSDEYLLNINKQFLNHDYFTDIITFSYCEDLIVSGDIFISVDRIKENAIKFKVTFENELLRVMIHGVLHLLGYDDGTTKEKKIMRNMENKYLDFSR
jgi:probable rRNA maturation factor